MEKIMKKAIEYIIENNKDQAEIPVCAIVIKNNEIISIQMNKKEKNKNPLHHAEILAIEEACKKINSKYLDGCDIYITLEPCLMCYGAILEARLDNIIYGASSGKFGFTNYIDVQKNKKIKGTITCGILEEECALLLKTFFENKRDNV